VDRRILSQRLRHRLTLHRYGCSHNDQGGVVDFNLSESAVAVRDGVAAIGARYGLDYWDACDAEKR
jgi:hypothetical protein